MIDPHEIERKIDRAIAAPTPVNLDLGGVRLENLGQVLEFSKLMSISGLAVPAWLRNNPGGCLAICSRAMRWGLDPFAVAEQSYVARGKGGEDHIGFMAQLIHAVITAHAPLKGRLRTEILGQGDERRCKVWGTFKGETAPHEYTSETLGRKKENIGTNDKGQLKGSPLWISDPEVQLRYSAVRQWCRLHSSETILGVFSVDELDDEPAPPPASTLAERLRDATKLARVEARGFDPAHVASVIEGEAQEELDESDSTYRDRIDATRNDRREMASDHQRGDDKDKSRSARAIKEPQSTRAPTPRQTGSRKATGQDQDLFEPRAKSHSRQAPPPKGKR
jgi:hypothetical protein